MKKFIISILFIVCLFSVGLAQNSAEVFSRSTVVALDSNVTQYLWIPFYAPRAGRFNVAGTNYKHTDLNTFSSSTLLNFPSGVFNNGNMVVHMYLDTVAGAVESSDSLVTYGLKVNAQGKTFGDTLDLDWNTDHAVEASATKYTNMLNWTQQRSQADTSRSYYWVDFTAEYEACAGILIVFEQYAVGTANGTRNRARISTQEVR